MATDWTSKDPTEWTYGVAGSGGGSGGGGNGGLRPVVIPDALLTAPSRDPNSVFVSASRDGAWHTVEITPAGINTANPNTACVFAIDIPGVDGAVSPTIDGRAPRVIILEMDSTTDNGTITCVLPADSDQSDSGDCGARMAIFSTNHYAQITSGTSVLQGSTGANLTSWTVVYQTTGDVGAVGRSVGNQYISLLTDAYAYVEDDIETLDFAPGALADRVLVTVGTNQTTGPNLTVKFRAWVLMGTYADWMTAAIASTP